MKFSQICTIATLALAGFATNTLAATPTRVGPVSQYGQLQAGKNTTGKGRIFGSCSDYAPGTNNTVRVDGMSMYWSINKSNTEAYWNATSVKKFVNSYGMEIIRAAIGVDLDWGYGNYFDDDEGYYEGKIDDVVNAAIANDIYVIIDYHSHCAETHTSDAVNFFSHMAQKWGSYDNVIFEIYNEPIGTNGTIYCEGKQDGQTLQTPTTYWKNAVLPYANKVIAAIRNYSDNLIVVGTPQWDQHPEVAINYPVTDSKSNSAYTMHYYAGTHESSGSGSVGANTLSAINAGLSIFVTEWGTSKSDGDTYGGAAANNTWRTFMKNNELSGANWSMAALKEGSAFYTATGAISTSGQYMIDYVLPGSGKTYTKCSGSTTPTTPKSSSSTIKSSSSTTVIVDGTDVLNGKGVFNNCSSLTGCGWTTNIRQYAGYVSAYAGNIKIEENDDEKNVLNFWSNGVVTNAWDLQAKHSITLTKGYAYQIVGGGYTFNDSYGKVAISVVDEDDYTYLGINQAIDGPFESEVYEHCKATDATASIHIDGGLIQGETYISGTGGTYGGGFAIQEVKVLATPISCGGSTPVSSSSIRSSSSAIPASSTSIKSSASTTAPGADVIDDLEDGDNIPYTPGFWMAYNDNGSVDDWGEHPKSSFANPVVGDDGQGNTIYEVVFPNISSSNYAAALKGIILDAGNYEYDPYVNLVLELDSLGGYDLTSCTTIKYDYKGAGHQFETVMANDYEGALTKFNFHQVYKAASSSWTTATISWTSLKQQSGWGKTATLNKSNIGRFVWDVRDDTYNYLYVDNVRCVGATINKTTSVASSSSTAPKSSSSIAHSSSSIATIKSSSSVAPASSNSITPASSAGANGSWVSANALLTNNAKDKVSISQSTGSGSRKVTRTLDTEKNGNFKVAFNISATAKDVLTTILVRDADGNNLCKENIELSLEPTSYKCTFVATSNETTLTITVASDEGIVNIDSFKFVEVEFDGILPTTKSTNNYMITKGNNVLQITNPKNGAIKVELFDVMGNMISRTVSTNTVQLSLDNVLSGSYVVRINGTNGTAVTKLNVK